MKYSKIDFNFTDCPDDIEKRVRKMFQEFPYTFYISKEDHDGYTRVVMADHIYKDFCDITGCEAFRGLGWIVVAEKEENDLSWTWIDYN